MTGPDGEVRTAVPVGAAGRALLLVEPRPATPGPDDRRGDHRPVALFSSGLGGAWFDWLPVIDALGSGVRCLVVERPGVSDAPRWDAGTGELAEMVADLVAALDAAGVGRAVLVGHSLGAWYVEACARSHPDRAAGLVLVDGSLAPWPEARVGTGPGPATGPVPGSGSVPTPSIPDCRRRHRAADLATRVLGAVVPLIGGWVRVGPAIRMLIEGHAVRRASSPAQRSHCRRSYGRPGPWPAILHEWAGDARMRLQLTALRAERRLPRLVVVPLVAARTRIPAVDPWARLHRRALRALVRHDPAVTVRPEVVPRAPHVLMHTHPDRVADAIRAALPRDTSPREPRRP